MNEWTNEWTMNDEWTMIERWMNDEWTMNERKEERWWERDEWSSGPGNLCMIEKWKDETGLCVKQANEQFWIVRQVG